MEAVYRRGCGAHVVFSDVYFTCQEPFIERYWAKPPVL